MPPRRFALPLLLLLLASPAALAQSAAELDVVRTTDGTLLRGQVTEVRAGQLVRLRLLTGEAREVPWALVLGVRGPGFEGVELPLLPPPARPAAPVPPSLPPPPPGSESLGAPQRITESLEGVAAGPEAGMVPVEFHSTRRPLTVGIPQFEYLAPSYGTRFGGAPRLVTVSRWVCQTPCRLFALPGPRRFAVRTSENFESQLSATVPAGGLRLHVHDPSAGAVLGGVILVMTGVGLTIVGVFALGFGAARTDLELEVTGGVSLGVGVVSLGLGGLLLGRNPVGIASQQPLAGAPVARW